MLFVCKIFLVSIFPPSLEDIAPLASGVKLTVVKSSHLLFADAPARNVFKVSCRVCIVGSLLTSCWVPHNTSVNVKSNILSTLRTLTPRLFKNFSNEYFFLPIKSMSTQVTPSLSFLSYF